uniref:Dihydroxyacetone kinase n=1 Tax=Paramoeba aestuarina TaxID=180227 RepID=A0A7S4UUQ3_9EUKA|mmetsp:Transcript_40091/g.63396  ORF Transcript_40091/g.63396 Transcript_40091/m.63396 type:complete len:626 (+) Transcript_40091:521-2398(+)
MAAWDALSLHILSLLSLVSLLFSLSSPSLCCCWREQFEPPSNMAAAAKKQFVRNRGKDVVSDFIQSYLFSRPDVVKLPGYDVLVRADYKEHKQDKVAILCGGGSGHEPAHFGFIGSGMLSGAVAGGVFASPSAKSVYEAIVTVSGKKGCLVLIKNYTGDRLNFGLACERAREEGIDVEMVIVDDDAAIEVAGSIPGRRGVAGTILVQKICGAVAEAGGSLQEVKQAAEQAKNSVCTMGVALSGCTLPGHARDASISPNIYELGMGIHGESGKEKVEMEEGDKIAERMIAALLGSSYATTFGKGTRVVLMINNLGGTPVIETYCMAQYFLESLKKREMSVERILIGSFMTSLDMEGVSVSVMKVDGSSAHFLAHLDAPTKAPSWPASGCTVRCTPFEIEGEKGGVKEEKGVGEEKVGFLKGVVEEVCRALISEKERLNEIDSHVGDGDTGDTFSRGAGEISARKENGDIRFTSGGKLLTSIADGISHNMGGSSGAVLEIFFRSAGTYLLQNNFDEPTAKQWVEAFQKGCETVQFYGGASEGMRTMLDAMIPALQAASAAAEENKSNLEILKCAAAAADAGVEETKTMKGLAGRSSYITAEDLLSWPDSGALGFAIALRAVVNNISA